MKFFVLTIIILINLTQHICADYSTIVDVASQIRVKQLATKKAQDSLQEKIVKSWESDADTSGSGHVLKMQTRIDDYVRTSFEVDSIISGVDVGKLGDPIKFNKTSKQLTMANDWLKTEEGCNRRYKSW